MPQRTNGTESCSRLRLRMTLPPRSKCSRNTALSTTTTNLALTMWIRPSTSKWQRNESMIFWVSSPKRNQEEDEKRWLLQLKKPKPQTSMYIRSCSPQERSSLSLMYRRQVRICTCHSNTSSWTILSLPQLAFSVRSV